MTKPARKTAPISPPAAPPAAPCRIDLPAVLDLSGAATVKAVLDDARGAPVVLDASTVERVGGLGQQILRAAAKSWAADGQPFAIAAPSEGFTKSAALLGLDFTDFVEGTTP